MMRITNRWIGYCGSPFRRKLVDTVLTLDPHATMTMAPGAAELREEVLRTPGTHVAIGCTDGGVSEVNLAAAIVADGAALDVVLVVDHASGSLKSRAVTAGVADVIDLSQFTLVDPSPLAAWDGPGRERQADGGPAHADGGESGRTGLPEPSEAHFPPDGYGAGGGSMRGLPGSPEGWPERDRFGSFDGLAPDEDRTSVLGAGGTDEVTSVLGAGVRHGVGARDSDWNPYRGRVRPVVPQGGPGRDAAAPPAGIGVPPILREEGDPNGTGQAQTPERGDAPILTFVSGRGGVGKTVMAAVTACVAASWGMRVSLCDLDFSCGNLYACFGLPRPADLSVLSERESNDAERIERLGVSCGEGIRLWGGCSRPEMAELLWPHASEVLCVASQASDLVLVDSSSTFTDAVAQSAQMCDRLLITIDGRPGSSVAQARLGALAVRLGVARTRIVRLANRCDPKGRDETVINRADVGLETARSLRVLEGGETVNEFVAAGQVSDLAGLESPFVQSLTGCLGQLLSEMGRLPDCDAARQSLEQRRSRRHRWLGRRREAV